MNKEFLKEISILYVEDEHDVREFTSKLLNSLFKEVFVANDGLEGLELFKEHTKDIDLIVSDINMPNMDGLLMSHEIKKIDATIPIIVTSAHNNPSFLKKAIDVGISSYAMKPIDLYQLISTIIKTMEPIFLKRKIEEIGISSENTSLLDNLINQEDNLILIYNKENKLIKANKKFLELFHLESLEMFYNKYEDIYDLFEDEYGFISKKTLTSKDWISYIQNLPELDRAVKIKTNQNGKSIFTINVDSYRDENEFYIFSLIDVTNLKEKSSLIEYQSNYDKLTGLYNKNKFQEFCGKEIRRAKRYNSRLSLLAFTINAFNKHISDNILKEVLNIVMGNIREHDIISRYSDEDLFLILLPETPLSGGEVVAQKIQESILSSELDKEGLKVKLDFGIAVSEENDTEENLIKKSIENLKNNTKNL